MFALRGPFHHIFLICAAACAAVVLNESVCHAALANQDPAWRSDLTQTTGPTGITQSAFASLMQQYLISNNQANVLDAAFMFQECYGGGMITGLENQLGNTINWVAGSASQWNQKAQGQLSPAENMRSSMPQPANSMNVGNPPWSFWTQQLVPGLATANQTVLTSIDNATAKDPVGVNGKPMKETGQSATSTNGGQILLTDPNAKNYVGIIWAGNPDAARHFTNVNAIYDTLAAAWKGQASNIFVLYGFGTTNGSSGGQKTWTGQRADYNTLNNDLKGLQQKNLINPNTEFVFYATDHGSSLKIVKQPAPAKVAPKQGTSDGFSLDEDQLTSMQENDDNPGGNGGGGTSFDQFEPYVEINYDSLDSDSPVYLNGQFIGNLPAAPGGSLATVDLNVPTFDLGGNNNINIVNNDSSQSFNLDEVDFSTGEVDDGPPPLPLPKSSVAAPLLIVLAAWSARRRRL